MSENENIELEREFVLRGSVESFREIAKIIVDSSSNAEAVTRITNLAIYALSVTPSQRREFIRTGHIKP